MIIIKSNFPKSILNEIKWKQLDMKMVTIEYTNRGSPNDIGIIHGKDIINIDKYYIEIKRLNLNKYYIEVNSLPQNTCIPYHRIKKIMYGTQQIFSRN